MPSTASGLEADRHPEGRGTDLIPRRALFGHPVRTHARLSPDGDRLAWLAPVDGVLNVWVGDRDGNDAAPVTADSGRGVRSFRWAHTGRHLLYPQDVGGDENWHVLVVDLDAATTVDLTPFDKVSASVLMLSARHPDTVLLSINARDPQWHDVHQLTLSTGDIHLVQPNDGAWLAMVPDDDLEVRAVVSTDDEGNRTIHVRDDARSDFVPFVQVPFEHVWTTGQPRFSRDGRVLYAASSVGADRGRLVAWDLDTGAEEVLAEDDEVDLARALGDAPRVIDDADSHRPLAVLVDADRPCWRVIDPAVAPDVSALDDALGSGWIPVSRTDDDREWIVESQGDTDVAVFHRWERRTGELTELFRTRDDLDESALAPMEPFSFNARDGLVVHGYLTVPLGVEAADLPAVLHVHGGPWARHRWGLDPQAQWLANRGYAVVQVNYRGSTGYGATFVNAGDREWAGAMHDDLLDAIDHLANQRVIDADRVAIYGGSYGGYAALVGATFTPERFVCAVDLVGPSDLRTLIASIPPYWKPDMSLWRRRVGDLDTEPDFLWSRSPLSRVDDLSIPVLIGQGANDPRVTVAESDQIVAALRDRGIPHEYLLFADEGHGFARPENALRFYARVEAFLAEHLGGRCEPAGHEEFLQPTSRIAAGG